MIRRTFIAPNFVCKVKQLEGSGEPISVLKYANSEQELRDNLSKQFEMISVAPYSFNDEWRQEADCERARACEARSNGNQYEFRSAIWKHLKQYLFDLFGEKCAYCESVVDVVSSGDVEHYRPKKKVEGVGTHPGYYWLAYEISNLFPCCELCNRARGKMNQFPLENEMKRANGPQVRLDTEGPLLLNPYEDDPAAHLEFLPSHQGNFTGGVTAKMIDGSKSKKGIMSINVYNLMRAPLLRERAKSQEDIIPKLHFAFTRGGASEVAKIFRKLNQGEGQHSAACLAEARAWFLELKRQVEPLAS